METGVTGGKGAADPRYLSPTVLAYIGDAVYELFVRTFLISQADVPVSELHKKTVGIVKASSQAEAVSRIDGALTDEERDMVRRGRNAKGVRAPRHADMIDYKYATGLEALFGYLYLNGDMERLKEILMLCVQASSASTI